MTKVQDQLTARIVRQVSMETASAKKSVQTALRVNTQTLQAKLFAPHVAWENFNKMRVTLLAKNAAITQHSRSKA